MQVLLSIPFRTSSGTRKSASVISQVPAVIFQVVKAGVRIHAMKVSTAVEPWAWVRRQRAEGISWFLRENSIGSTF